MIRLNNGGVSPSPTAVLEQMMRDLRLANESTPNVYTTRGEIAIFTDRVSNAIRTGLA